MFVVERIPCDRRPFAPSKHPTGGAKQMLTQEAKSFPGTHRKKINKDTTCGAQITGIL